MYFAPLMSACRAENSRDATEEGREFTVTSTMITKRNVELFSKIAAPEPNAPITNPAKPGPIARATVNCTEFSRTASSMSSSGTSEGTNACQVDAPNPVAIPLTNPTPTIRHGVSWSVAYIMKREKLAHICTDWVTMRIFFREIRSATTPAYGVSNTAGTEPTSDEKPNHVATLGEVEQDRRDCNHLHPRGTVRY